MIYLADSFSTRLPVRLLRLGLINRPEVGLFSISALLVLRRHGTVYNAIAMTVFVYGVEPLASIDRHSLLCHVPALQFVSLSNDCLIDC